MPWEAELSVALQAAQRALEILSVRPEAVEHKGRIDLVTDVDRRCEEAVRQVLAPTGIPLLGEEGGGLSTPTRWVIDPLDGTTNFVHGFPWYATSIGLEVDGEVVVGVVAEPVRRRIFRATRGGGAYLDDERLQVSRTDDLAQALLATGFPYDRAERAEVLLRPFRALLERTRGIRRAGAASLDLAYVAAGALDGFWEVDLSPWDVSAGTLLVEEAGGRVTDHTGRPSPPAPTSPLASNGPLHDALQQVLAEHPLG